MSTIKRLQDQFNQLANNVSIKRLFTGYGIFHNGMMFALYQSGAHYLRAEGTLVNVLEKLGAARYQDIHPHMNPQLALFHYYQLPQAVIKNPSLHQKLVQFSLKQLNENHLRQELFRKERIKELKNLSIKHERLLAKVGIMSVQELHQLGAFNAYIQIKKHKLTANVQVFLTLYAALQNRPLNSLSQQRKQQVIMQLNELLIENKLRKVKW